MNYCTKCGKEIPEGDNKLCEECKNSLLTDLENEEGKANFKISKEQKEKSKKEKKNNKGFKFIIGLVVFIILLIGLEVTTNCFGKLIGKYNKVGISIGNNNNNFGYANKQGDWIYFMTLSKDASKIAINRIKDDGTKKEVLRENDWEIFSINVYGKYLYFVAFEQVTDENMYQNNKIYKMSLDGKELTVINDNEFSDDCKTIYVINDRIYYIGEDYNIYSMNLDGGDRVKINDNKTGFIGVTDKYILYNDYPENPESETDFVTYIMNLDGTNSRIINGERLYNPNIVGNKIYYVNGDNSEIHRVDVNGENDTVIYKSPAYNMNVSDGYIYYLNYKNENADSEDEIICIHKIRIDGTEHEVICDMENYSSFINVVGNWIYYTDFNEDRYYINMIKTDGSNTVTLYTYGMNSTSNIEENSEEKSIEVTETKETNTVVTNNSNTTNNNTVSNTTNNTQQNLTSQNNTQSTNTVNKQNSNNTVTANTVQ